MDARGKKRDRRADAPGSARATRQRVAGCQRTSRKTISRVFNVEFFAMRQLRLRLERRRRQISQSNVAASASISQPELSFLESGRLRPSTGQVEKLVRFFDISGDELFAEVEDEAGER
jgi:ribosome-binding protein aMBF1 (putative translation factor)